MRNSPMQEEVRDLLVTTSGPRTAVSIREVLGGGVCLYGAVEREVSLYVFRARVGSYASVRLER